MSHKLDYKWITNAAIPINAATPIATMIRNSFPIISLFERP
jgi:hypothetical protein